MDRGATRARRIRSDATRRAGRGALFFGHRMVVMQPVRGHEGFSQGLSCVVRGRVLASDARTLSSFVVFRLRGAHQNGMGMLRPCRRSGVGRVVCRASCCWNRSFPDNSRMMGRVAVKRTVVAGVGRGKQGHLVDALAPRGDEGRGTLRQALGSREQALIRGFPNGATHPLRAGIVH